LPALPGREQSLQAVLNGRQRRMADGNRRAELTRREMKYQSLNDQGERGPRRRGPRSAASAAAALSARAMRYRRTPAQTTIDRFTQQPSNSIHRSVTPTSRSFSVSARRQRHTHTHMGIHQYIASARYIYSSPSLNGDVTHCQHVRLRIKRSTVRLPTRSMIFAHPHTPRACLEYIL
jgi:hypothetical protein